MEQSHRNLYALEDGTLVAFNCEKLNSAIIAKKSSYEKYGIKCSKQRVMERLAEDTSISLSAIKHWCAGRHTPSDLGKIRDIARALGVDMSCLIEVTHKTGKDENLMRFDRLKNRTLEEIWTEIIGEMSKELTEIAVNTWFADCKLVLITKRDAVLATTSGFKRDIIRMRYGPVVHTALRKLYSWHGNISVVVS